MRPPTTLEEKLTGAILVAVALAAIVVSWGLAYLIVRWLVHLGRALA